MSKKWTKEESGFALDSAWSAFFNTLMLHVSQDELERLEDNYSMQEAYGYTMDAFYTELQDYQQKESK